jgi:hypothetical protein
MIELKIDDKVLPALQRAFATPPGRARRALLHYVGTLKHYLIQSLSRGQSPIELKMNLFSLPLHELSNKGGQIGKKKVRVHAWLRQNGLALVEPVEIGSNLTGKISKVKFTDLVKLEWHEPETTKEKYLIDALTVNSDSRDRTEKLTAEVFDLLYPDFSVCLADGRFAEVFDAVDIDIKSLKNYIAWLQNDAKHFTKTKHNQYFFQARLIMAVAQHTGGIYLQRKIKSDFGRTYYKGISIQNVNKDLRHAMLGACWEYDIRSSVVAWKMGFAKAYVSRQATLSTVNNEFSMTLAYLRDKKAFMKSVQSSVFEGDCDLPEELQLKMLKQAFTALSFGARKTGKGWMNENGEWQNPSLVEIFKRSEERSRFLADPQVTSFASEQAKLDDYIYGQVVAKCPDLLKLKYLQTHSGRPSKPKMIAFLYQHDETEVMDIVRATLAERGRAVLGNIHDAIVVKHRLTADLKTEIEMRMREQTNNDYWSLGVTEVGRWETSAKELKNLENEFRKLDADEMNLVEQFMNKRAHDFAGGEQGS